MTTSEQIKELVSFANLSRTIMIGLAATILNTVMADSKNLAVLASKSLEVNPKVKFELDKKYNISESVLLTNRVITLERKLDTHRDKAKH